MTKIFKIKPLLSEPSTDLLTLANGKNDICDSCHESDSHSDRTRCSLED